VLKGEVNVFHMPPTPRNKEETILSPNG